jgi:hypothetical protein
LPQGRDVPGREEKGGERLYQDQDFDHLWANHLLARERSARGREEVERGGSVARGAALLSAFFR